MSDSRPTTPTGTGGGNRLSLDSSSSPLASGRSSGRRPSSAASAAATAAAAAVLAKTDHVLSLEVGSAAVLLYDTTEVAQARSFVGWLDTPFFEAQNNFGGEGRWTLPGPDVPVRYRVAMGSLTGGRESGVATQRALDEAERRLMEKTAIFGSTITAIEGERDALVGEVAQLHRRLNEMQARLSAAERTAEAATSFINTATLEEAEASRAAANRGGWLQSLSSRSLTRRGKSMRAFVRADVPPASAPPAATGVADKDAHIHALESRLANIESLLLSSSAGGTDTSHTTSSGRRTTGSRIAGKKGTFRPLSATPPSDDPTNPGEQSDLSAAELAEMYMMYKAKDADAYLASLPADEARRLKKEVSSQLAAGK